jgi:hypothetical protein
LDDHGRVRRLDRPFPASDHLWQYFPPAIGCAIANYIGNTYGATGGGVWAGLILLAVIGYIMVVLKPFDQTT